MAKEKNLNIAGVVNNEILGEIRRVDNSTHVRVFSDGVPSRESEQGAVKTTDALSSLLGTRRRSGGAT